MKNLFLALSLSMLIGTVLTLNSCKKETTSTEDDSVSAEDAVVVTKAMGITADDGSAVAGQESSFSGKTEGLIISECISSIDSSVAKQLTITYNGTTCFDIKRTGTITVNLVSLAQWETAGAQISITYNNLQVTDELSGVSYAINGTHTVTNEIGGLAWQIVAGIAPANDSTEHRITSSDMTITFPGGSQRVWTFDRTRKWSNASGIVTLTEYTQATGNIDVQGTNRYGNTFTNTVITPIASNGQHALCYFLPYQGELQHQVGSRTATVTFGTNSTGTPDGSPTVCGGGFYISYQNASNGVSLTKYIPY